MGSQKYCVKWKNRFEHFQTIFTDFIDQQVLCDVTLVSEGEIFKAHQFVLAGCSRYFKKIFLDLPKTQHPIVFLRDVTSLEIKCLLDYMYKGETVIPNALMSGFLKTCESLCIEGLCEDQTDGSQNTDRIEDQARVSSTESANSTDERESWSNGILYSSSHVMELCAQKDKENVHSKKRINKNIDNEFIKAKLIKHCDNTKLKTKQITVQHSLTGDARSNYLDKHNGNRISTNQQSLDDLTQIELSNNETAQGMCSNNSIVQTDVLDSPPRSPQSIIFSVRQSKVFDVQGLRANTASESLIILPDENNEILVISDDNSSTNTTCKQPSKSDEVQKNSDTNGQTNFLEKLDLQANSLDSDDSMDEFQLVLSPDIAANGEDDETDQSEIIASSKNIHRLRTKSPSFDNSNNYITRQPVSQLKSTKKTNEEVGQLSEAKNKAIQQGSRLKVVLTDVQSHARSHSNKPLPERNVNLAGGINENEPMSYLQHNEINTLTLDKKVHKKLSKKVNEPLVKKKKGL